MPPTNLPGPISELIGRDDELREVVSLAASHRLVTLTGPGGIGKTRLALAAARELLPEFAAWCLARRVLAAIRSRAWFRPRWRPRRARTRGRRDFGPARRAGAGQPAPAARVRHLRACD